MNGSNKAAAFMLGILIGVLGGFLIGAFFGKSVFQLASMLIHVATKGKSDEDRMKFELLLQ